MKGAAHSFSLNFCFCSQWDCRRSQHLVVYSRLLSTGRGESWINERWIEHKMLLDVPIKPGNASAVFSTSNLRYCWHAVLLHILVLRNMASSDEEAGINEPHGNTNLSGLEEISFA